MKTIPMWCIGIGVCTNVLAAPVLPSNAYTYLPELGKVIEKEWSDLYRRDYLAAQIEQESCVSLKSPRCWNPKVELKTDREYGFGLGQLTIAYRKDGSVRFDNFQLMKEKFPQLKDWKWENRFDPFYQIQTMVLMDKNLYNNISWAHNDTERMAFMFSGYNGGLNGVIQDRTLCSHTPGCDPSKWFGHVEKQSFKSKIKNPGYGESAFDINRGYVRNVMFVRNTKYIPYMKK